MQNVYMQIYRSIVVVRVSSDHVMTSPGVLFNLYKYTYCTEYIIVDTMTKYFLYEMYLIIYYKIRHIQTIILRIMLT